MNYHEDLEIKNKAKKKLFLFENKCILHILVELKDICERLSKQSQC